MTQQSVKVVNGEYVSTVVVTTTHDTPKDDPVVDTHVVHVRHQQPPLNGN